MNRCSSPRLRAWTLTLALAAGALAMIALPAEAQTPDPQRIPPMKASAQRGALRVIQPPEVLLNGQPARLAPGARIRGRNNLLVVSGALIGQDLPVRYTLDPLGLVHEVWVLTDTEAAADRPPPVQVSPY